MCVCRYTHVHNLPKHICTFVYNVCTLILQGIRITELPSEEHEESKDLPDKVPILNKLKKLNTNLANIEVLSHVKRHVHLYIAPYYTCSFIIDN